jgi:hypothetical protein
MAHRLLLGSNLCQLGIGDGSLNLSRVRPCHTIVFWIGILPGTSAYLFYSYVSNELFVLASEYPDEYINEKTSS